ncbi:MAG: hypothetical protein KKF46_03400 [Nanoarchaeota archaeon]|nr:hypothetical protein [Nanoarchaeota archaeon]MBU1321380.1 hypothetical protein [Nanoarchaeota archaeon]MBU1597440.1 hypothetical protein [Nanoarchaeota archaeon]MBU2441354.1 hypothetical protein [Nanoarchaeota archaeon]
MKNNNLNNVLKKSSVIFLLIIIISLVILSNTNYSVVLALPQGATITFNETENASTRPADTHIAAGGSFTSLVLNVTSQTSKWKAYVGNVTGRYVLQNSNNNTIYDWTLSSVQGEVYVSRNDSVEFSTLACANEGNITAEDTALNINSSSDDSINQTFIQKTHKTFVIGGTGTISNSSCYAIATYIDDEAQTIDENANFQEILLSDNTNMVYVTLLEDEQSGFDGGNYDFQIIVPDDPGVASTPYYFYAELG